MDRDRRLSLTVGGFALASLATLAVAILSLSEQRGIWAPRYRLIAHFDNVQGLIGGASVRLAGTRVGQVQAVEFGERATGEPALRVVLQIDRDVQERIRRSSVASITTVGLLGDQIVELTIGTADSPVLQDGDEIATISPFDLNAMVAKGAAALDAIQSLATNLDDTLTQFGEELGGRKLAGSVAALADIVTEIQEGDGALHSLIYERYEGGALASFEDSLASLSNILREVEQGQGVLHALIYEEQTDQGLFIQVLEAGGHLNDILAKIERGEGTLGLMLNDPTLYEELKVLVGGANRSTVVRSLIDLVTPDEN
jgi:phospholipid/cholesterol/gamma-HCH transport system substrate-binding protein